jgi:hypothetical protein
LTAPAEGDGVRAGVAVRRSGIDAATAAPHDYLDIVLALN